MMLYHKAVGALVNARPVRSSFPVGAAGLIRSESGLFRIEQGWNDEAGNAASTHAEQNLHARLTEGEELIKLVVVGKDKKLLAPCGKCREYLSTDSLKTEVLISSASDKVGWISMRALLPIKHNAISRVGDFKTDFNILTLFKKAVEVLSSRPYVPYEKESFGVVAMKIDDGGFIVTVDSQRAHYGQRHALVKALMLAESQKSWKIEKILFMHTAKKRMNRPVYPCGDCLQDLYEFSQVADRNIPIIIARQDGLLYFSSSRDLLPYPFGPKELGVNLSSFC